MVEAGSLFLFPSQYSLLQTIWHSRFFWGGGDCRIPTSHLTVGVLGLQTYTTHTGFNMGSGNCSQVIRLIQKEILPIEPAMWPPEGIFKK